MQEQRLTGALQKRIVERLNAEPRKKTCTFMLSVENAAKLKSICTVKGWTASECVDELITAFIDEMSDEVFN